ncbi:hypothetical protein MD484_g337, partial [Candolleomyces efflorescens]
MEAGARMSKTEISRLQNSLNKLYETQVQLKEYVEESKEGGESDPEILQAMADNVVVIGSQQERISILKMALSEKGIVTSGAHYEQQGAKVNHGNHTEQQGTTVETTGDDEGGVYL